MKVSSSGKPNTVQVHFKGLEVLYLRTQYLAFSNLVPCREPFWIKNGH